MSDVRRGRLTKYAGVFIDDPDGTHALMEWEEYERLRKVNGQLEEIVKVYQDENERLRKELEHERISYQQLVDEFQEAVEAP